MSDDDTDFSAWMTGVKRLHSDRINRYSQRKKPTGTLNARKPFVEPEPVHRPDSLAARDSHFNPGIQKKLQRRIRQGLIRPGASLDLHGFRQQEAIEALNEFIEQSMARGERMVIVIHGQGYRSQQQAVLKPLVQRWLSGHNAVLAWCPAQIRDGAGGASYVYLRAN